MIHIKKLNQNNLTEFIQLIKVFNIVFENRLSLVAEKNYLLQLLSKEEFVVLTVAINSSIIGGLTAIKLPSVYKNEDELFIYDIAILSQYQKQGIGSKLIQSLKEYCVANAIKIVFVDADSDDINAVKFYKQTGAFSKDVVHFEYSLNATDAIEKPKI